MKYRALATAFISLVFLCSGCRKEGLKHIDCTGFKQGIVSNDTERVRRSIAEMLGNYSQDNINKLAEAISAQCGVKATADCFECIKTLPPQTEIIVSFTQNGTTFRKLLDISYTPDNRMQMLAMHD